MKRIAMLGLLVALGAAPRIAFAQASAMNAKGMDMKSMDMKSMDMQHMGMNKKTMTKTHKGIGVVRDVNTADGVITLAHEPIKSLNWPAMTMGFKVKNKTMLDKVKPGDKVQFTLVQTGKDYVITSVK